MGRPACREFPEQLVGCSILPVVPPVVRSQCRVTGTQQFIEEDRSMRRLARLAIGLGAVLVVFAICLSVVPSSDRAGSPYLSALSDLTLGSEALAAPKCQNMA